MFAYPLPSIPTHFQPILIETQSNPIGIDAKSEFSLRCYPPNDINEQDPYALHVSDLLTRAFAMCCSCGQIGDVN